MLGHGLAALMASPHLTLPARLLVEEANQAGGKAKTNLPFWWWN